ncbi:hypothetical protein Tco_1531693 [Tanacetum coccineum]
MEKSKQHPTTGLPTIMKKEERMRTMDGKLLITGGEKHTRNKKPRHPISSPTYHWVGTKLPCGRPSPNLITLYLFTSLNSKQKPQPPPPKLIIIHPCPDLCTKLSHSLIGELENMDTLLNLHNILEEIHLNNIRIKYLGGSHILLVLPPEISIHKEIQGECDEIFPVEKSESYESDDHQTMVQDEPGDSNDDNNEEDDDDYLDDDDFDVDLMLDNEHGVIGDLSGSSTLENGHEVQKDNILVLDTLFEEKSPLELQTTEMEKAKDVALDNDGAYVTSRDQRYGPAQTFSSMDSSCNTTIVPDTPSKLSNVRMTKVIKGELEKLEDLKVEDVLLTSDTSLEVFNNKFNRLRRMDDDLFTYEVEVANIPCDSNMDDDSEHEADDAWDMIHLMLHLLNGNDEVELTDEESFDNEDDVTEVFRIDTNIFDYETPLCLAFNEFNHLLKVDLDLLTKDIMGFKTYEDYKDDWIYEWNENVPWTGCSEWPTCSWREDGYCNEGNLPDAYVIGNLLHYQDLEWYEALEDCELKEEALRNKANMEGLIEEDDDDELRYKQRRQWNVYTNYDDAYEINHDVAER